MADEGPTVAYELYQLFFQREALPPQNKHRITIVYHERIVFIRFLLAQWFAYI